MVYRFITTLILLFVQNNVFSQETIIFEENFNDNSNNWITKDDNIAFKKVQNGKFIIEPKPNKATASWKEVKIDTKRDFSISCNTLWTGGVDNSGYGLVWGFSDETNFFSFSINTLGNYFYGILISSKWSSQ